MTHGNKKTVLYLVKEDNHDNPQIKSLCLNDSPVMADEEYDEVHTFVENEFEIKFPDKSSFEI